MRVSGSAPAHSTLKIRGGVSRVLTSKGVGRKRIGAKTTLKRSGAKIK